MNSKILNGESLSEGIGLGKALIINDKTKYRIKDYKVSESSKELEKLYTAVNKLKENVKNDISFLQGEEKEIMEAYLMILEDSELINSAQNLINNENYNAIYAVKNGLDEKINIFKNIDDEYLSQRAKDIEDIQNRLIDILSEKKAVNISDLSENTIIVANELTTSDFIKLDLTKTAGIIVKQGSKTSHVSIMARNKNIPMILGNIEDIQNEDYVGIDCEKGYIYCNPNAEIVYELNHKKEEELKEREQLEQYKNIDAVTSDGKKVLVAANIGAPEDLDSVIEANADAIGLFRTEFLYMNSQKLPTEEEQFESYKIVAENMNGKQVVIRTLDIGGDKRLETFNLKKEDNPFLGYRAIRICLHDVQLFKTQLRAILRASAFGNIAIMFPMISTLDELREAKNILEGVKHELDNEGIEYDKNISLGIMIEVPSAAIMADSFAKECDFFSIGTNDLIQYVMAAERGNDMVSYLYDKYNPAVLRLIKFVIDSAHNENIWCGMCGEASGDINFIPLLLEWGLDEFSMNVSNIAKAKKVIINKSYDL